MLKTKKLLFITSVVIFTMAVNSAWAESSYFDVPLSRQSKAYSCGQNSFRMVMGYWGTRLSRTDIFFKTGFNATSTATFDALVKKEYKNFKFEYVKKNLSGVKEQLKKGRPVMVAVDAQFLSYLNYGTSSGHFIVLTGFDDKAGVVYLRDSNSDYVESLDYKRLKKAWGGFGYKAFVIYSTGKVKAGKKPKHFSDSAKARGAKKVQRKVSFINFLIPTVYLASNGRMDSDNSLKLEETFPKQPFLYNIRLHGLYYGHMTLEKDPWLGNDKTFEGFAINVGFSFGGGLIFHNGENISPGLYYFGRPRTLEVLSFNTIKTIPYLTSSALSVEVSYYSGDKFKEFFSPEDNGISLKSAKGGRLGVRWGLGQILGNLSAGVSYSEVILRANNANTVVNPWAFDVTLGPLFGSYQGTSHEFSGNKLDKQSYNWGLNLNMNVLNIPLIRTLGLLNLFYQKSVDSSTLTGSGSTDTVTNTKNKFEFPLNLKIIHLMYGYSSEDRVFTSTTAADRDSTLRLFGLRVLFNHFLPKFQFQVGYQYGWEEFTYRSNRAHHAVNVGMYFSWM